MINYDVWETSVTKGDPNDAGLFLIDIKSEKRVQLKAGVHIITHRQVIPTTEKEVSSVVESHKAMLK